MRFLACLRLLSLFFAWVVALLWPLTDSNKLSECKLRVLDRLAVQRPQAERKKEYPAQSEQLPRRDLESGV